MKTHEADWLPREPSLLLYGVLLGGTFIYLLEYGPLIGIQSARTTTLLFVLWVPVYGFCAHLATEGRTLRVSLTAALIAGVAFSVVPTGWVVHTGRYESFPPVVLVALLLGCGFALISGTTGHLTGRIPDLYRDDRLGDVRVLLNAAPRYLGPLLSGLVLLVAGVLLDAVHL